MMKWSLILREPVCFDHVIVVSVAETRRHGPLPRRRVPAPPRSLVLCMHKISFEMRLTFVLRCPFSLKNKAHLAAPQI